MVVWELTIKADDLWYFKRTRPVTSLTTSIRPLTFPLPPMSSEIEQKGSFVSHFFSEYTRMIHLSFVKSPIPSLPLSRLYSYWMTQSVVVYGDEWPKAPRFPGSVFPCHVRRLCRISTQSPVASSLSPFPNRTQGRRQPVAKWETTIGTGGGGGGLCIVSKRVHPWFFLKRRGGGGGGLGPYEVQLSFRVLPLFVRVRRPSMTIQHGRTWISPRYVSTNGVVIDLVLVTPVLIDFSKSSSWTVSSIPLRWLYMTQRCYEVREVSITDYTVSAVDVYNGSESLQVIERVLV